MRNWRVDFSLATGCALASVLCFGLGAGWYPAALCGLLAAWFTFTGWWGLTHPRNPSKPVHSGSTVEDCSGCQTDSWSKKYGGQKLNTYYADKQKLSKLYAQKQMLLDKQQEQLAQLEKIYDQFHPLTKQDKQVLLHVEEQKLSAGPWGQLVTEVDPEVGPVVQAGRYEVRAPDGVVVSVYALMPDAATIKKDIDRYTQSQRS